MRQDKRCVLLSWGHMESARAGPISVLHPCFTCDVDHNRTETAAMIAIFPSVVAGIDNL